MSPRERSGRLLAALACLLPQILLAADARPELIMTQQPVVPPLEVAAGMLTAGCGDGARIVRVGPESTIRVLTREFHSACDPDLSFDGGQMLFAGKKRATDAWNVFELELASGRVRQVTQGTEDCRHPVYLGSFFTIDSPEPRHQIAFVSTRAGESNEYDSIPSTSLYSSHLDGSNLRRLTYNPSSDTDPTVLPDGRLLFSSWQRSTLERGPFGRIGLFAAQTDGSDYAVFSADEGRRIKRMPCVTTKREVVFVENDDATWDGSGSLAVILLRRNLHSHRAIARDEDGLFHSPSPLPDGRVLVSRRPRSGGGSHGVFRLDPHSGSLEPLFDDPDRHDIQARVVAARPRPDGRSSVVADDDPNGTLYCLGVHESDLGADQWIDADEPLRLRVLEALPRRVGGNGPPGSLTPRRFLGEIAIAEDGSFNVEVPANTPIELQLVDAAGLAIRSCGWIWVRNRERRGCIGCHEDGERTPENRFIKALERPSVPLVLPPESRRTVEYRRDVMPILAEKCSVAACHGSPSAEVLGEHLVPGRARTSPLVWHARGKMTLRPWDGRPGPSSLPKVTPPASAALTDEELRTLIEWIDLGAPPDGGESR